ACPTSWWPPPDAPSDCGEHRTRHAEDLVGALAAVGHRTRRRRPGGLGLAHAVAAPARLVLPGARHRCVDAARIRHRRPAADGLETLHCAPNRAEQHGGLDL